MILEAERLRQGLLRREHLELYHNSATFHHGINTLVSMLPAWVDGLAAQAERVDAMQQAAYEALMTTALPLHRTEAGWPNCSTCDGGGCPDCTDPA